MLLVILVPLVLGAVALAVRSNERRPLVLLAGALLHAAGVAVLFASPPARHPGEWLAFDAMGKVALLTTTILFVASAVYAQGYLRRRADRDNRIFVGGLLAMLGAMTTVAFSHHLGLSWVAIETTTLASVVVSIATQ